MRRLSYPMSPLRQVEAVLQAPPEMSRRIAILVLVTVVVAAGVTTCPRPVPACAMSVHARHACCDHVALRMARCCCAAGQRSAQLVSTAGPIQQDHAAKLLVAVPGWQANVSEAAALLAHYTRAGHGPAPPDTPIHNHIQLLL
jgi:hypothetical protein